MKILKFSLVMAAVAIFAGGATPAAAVTITLNATADHSGLVENNGNGTAQYDRVDTLWGSSSGNRRNGLVEFEQLSPVFKAGLIGGAFTLNSATLELWSGGPDWDETTLNFMRLNDADADWTGGIPDDGSAGQSSWTDKIESSDTEWSGPDPNGTPGGGIRGQIFGTLTSSATGLGLGAMKWEVPLSGSELLDWLTNPTISPNLLVEESVPGAGAQTRFATINSADMNDEFAANLVLDITIPEPSTFALTGLAFAASLVVVRRRS